jgi:hypothetical protein
MVQGRRATPHVAAAGRRLVPSSRGRGAPAPCQARDALRRDSRVPAGSGLGVARPEAADHGVPPRDHRVPASLDLGVARPEAADHDAPLRDHRALGDLGVARPEAADLDAPRRDPRALAGLDLGVVQLEEVADRAAPQCDRRAPQVGSEFDAARRDPLLA